MDKLLEAITSGVVPIITAALAMLIPAVTAYAVAWLKAQAALQEQAVRSAVNHVDALRGPAVDLTGAEAKAAAMRLVADQLPRVSEKLAEKLSAKIDSVVAEKRAGSEAPSAPDATPVDALPDTSPQTPTSKRTSSLPPT